MKEWSRTERYRKIEDVFIEEYEALLHSVEKARWRQKFHVQPVSGLLNDPNGLVQKGDTYHIFFQWFPLGAVHGLKYWYHASSKDLDRRRGPGRRRSDFLRAAEEGEMNQEQFMFLVAINAFKEANGRTFPTWTDVLEVVRKLGYRKTLPSDLDLSNRVQDWTEEPDSDCGV